MMAYYEIDVPVVPVLLFEVRPAKQEYEGDVYDEGGGCERERESRARHPATLNMLTNGM